MEFLDFLSASWPYIVAVVFAALLIYLIGIGIDSKKCPNCGKPAGDAPCGTNLCKDCCAECNSLLTKPCKHIQSCRNCRWSHLPWGKEPCIFCDNGSEWEQSNLDGQELD